MKSKWILGVAAAGVVAALLWREASTQSSESAVAAALPSAGAVRSGSGSGVVGAGPGDALMAPSSGGPAASPARLTLSGEFAVAKSYKTLYDRLSDSPEGQTAEGQYVLYRILRACANVTDRRSRWQRTGTDLQQQRDFVAGLPETDPNKAAPRGRAGAAGRRPLRGPERHRDHRGRAREAPRRCRGRGQPERARRAGRAGDVAGAARARAGARSPTLSETQIEALRAAMNSRDPEALLAAGRVLSNTFRDVTVRVGPDQAAVEGRALVNAFALVACEYGHPCGDNNLRMLNACAYQGHCAAGNLPDYLRYYVSSPNDTALQEQYRNALRQAIETGNWSAHHLRSRAHRRRAVQHIHRPRRPLTE